MTSKIVVLEGVSGAGKSHFHRMLLDRNSTLMAPPSMNFPRERSKALEVVGNSVSDYSIIALAMSYPNITVLCDRGFLGHYVYEAYKEYPRPHWKHELTQSIAGLEDQYHYELTHRWRDMKFIIERPTIQIIVLSPSNERLKLQRTQSGNEYPYEERDLYYGMAKELQKYKNEVYLSVDILEDYTAHDIEALID